MTAYAAPSPAFARRRASPGALALIIGAHAAAIALLMTSKMDIPIIGKDPPIVVVPIPIPDDPPPEPQPLREPSRQPSKFDTPKVEIPLPPMDGPIVDPMPIPIPDPLPPVGTRIDPQPQRQIAAPVRHGPRLATPAYLLRPPYPASKIRDEEEASLRLRLSIDERGRVTAVEPVGSVDPVFLTAARRHLIARWRYKPATEDGRPVASSTVITLRFELEG